MRAVVFPRAILAFGLLAATLCADEPVSFTRDVIPVLTKAGCNAGACHGSFQGRGRFRLSLLGFDPKTDYETIALHGRGRRVLPGSPANSLILRKATGAMPHGGGLRLTTDSPGYRILHDYIAQGLAPPPANGPHIARLEISPGEAVLQAAQAVPLKVVAHWSDGKAQDATAWSLYDSLDPGVVEVSPDGVVTAAAPGKTAVSVRYLGQVASLGVSIPFGPAQPFEFAPANYIDELLAAEWRRMGLAPAPLASDGDFVRRASLDLVGTLPTAEEARAFIASSDPNKRVSLIDQLLKRPEYADYWSLKWGDL
ncbi:MAG: Ig-like domain-containing protein, partial [Planctomycetaceae bacterium]|nr:Ig-like domain-containing protein [Planctomycetaceae bacterium]